MRRWFFILAGSLLVLVLLLGGGCGDNVFEPNENRPPETGLAITGQDLSTSLYKVMLKWWGSDPDGEVNGFHYRWTAEPGTEVFDLDTVWTYTAFASKEFLLPVPDTTAAFLFEVRAMDNLGLVDPTPASQTYPFYNNPPAVEIRFPELLPDSTWPVIALGWDAFDPDGDTTISRHLIWVKGREASPTEIDAEKDSVLLYPADLDTFGSVTIMLQTIDEGYAASPPDSFDVFLYPIKGDILLVDDYPLSNSPVVNVDGFYRTVLTDRVGEEGYTILNLNKTPFDTDVLFTAFLTAFDHVLWYTGNRQRSAIGDEQRFTQMSLADSGLAVHLDRGGNLFMASLNAIGNYGAISSLIYQEYFGLDTVYSNPVTASSNFEFIPIEEGGTRVCEIPLRAVEGTGLPDLTLRCPIRYLGVDAVVDTTDAFRAERLYYFPPGVFRSQPPVDFTLATRFDLPDPAGKVVLCTFPFSLYYAGENNDDVLNDWLDWFGAQSSP